jgi:hypothetical protein
MLTPVRTVRHRHTAARLLPEASVQHEEQSGICCSKRTFLQARGAESHTDKRRNKGLLLESSCCTAIRLHSPRAAAVRGVELCGRTVASGAHWLLDAVGQ